MVKIAFSSIIHAGQKFGCGFSIRTWSNLPQGSGLGTSSILAGCIVGALWAAIGLTYTVEHLIHAVRGVLKTLYN